MGFDLFQLDSIYLQLISIHFQLISIDDMMMTRLPLDIRYFT